MTPRATSSASSARRASAEPRRAPAESRRTSAEPRRKPAEPRRTSAEPRRKPAESRRTPAEPRRTPAPRGGGRATAGNTALAPRPGAAPASRVPASATRRRPALAVVPPADGAAPRTPFVLLVLVLVGSGLVGLLLLNTAINENAFRLHTVQKRQDDLDLREQQLKRDIEKVKAPGTLTAAARRQGLVPAGQPAYIYLPSGKVVGTPTPARASNPPPSPKPSPSGSPSGAAKAGTPGTNTTPGAKTTPGTNQANKPGTTPGNASPQPNRSGAAG